MNESEDPPKYALVDKQIGETPLQAISAYLKNHPELSGLKTAYAGRLDPQASGQLLVLIGDECKNRDHYQGLDKIYTFDLIVGISTDTGDIMGLIQEFEHSPPPVSLEQFQSALQSITTTYEQEFPAYSSKTVNGVPLWQIAKANKLSEIQIPSHEVTIYESQATQAKKISYETLFHDIKTRVTRVKGDFRQQEIINKWEQYLELSQSLRKDVQILSARVKVSSGTYIRQLTKDLREQLDTPLCCWHIHRDRVILK